MQNLKLKILFMTAVLLVAGFVNIQVVSANTGAIWTTTGTCGDPQNINHYVTGAQVFINGAGFPEGDYDWEIKGQPGQASNHPNIVVASGIVSVDETGAFCFSAYTIGAEDGGTYTAQVGNKSDNYRVEQVEPTPVPTEEPTPEPTPEDPVGPTPPPTDPTPTPTQDPEPEEESTPVTQSTPAPAVALTTGASSGPAGLIASAVSTLGLSGLSLGVWLKRRNK